MLIKSRPHLELLLPEEVHPGESIEAAVVLRCDKAVDVDDVTVRIQGTESFAEHSSALLSRVCSLGPQSLAPGVHRLPFSFEIPDGNPGSYTRTEAGAITYVAKVHV